MDRNCSVVDYGNEMNMDVSFSSLRAVDISDTYKMVWISGMMAFGEDEKMVDGDIEIQTRQCLENMKRNLAKVGGTMADVVAVTVFVKEMKGLDVIHRVRKEYFPYPYPTSTLVRITDFVNQVGLIEINGQAIIKK